MAHTCHFHEERVTPFLDRKSFRSEMEGLAGRIDDVKIPILASNWSVRFLRRTPKSPPRYWVTRFVRDLFDVTQSRPRCVNCRCCLSTVVKAKVVSSRIDEYEAEDHHELIENYLLRLRGHCRRCRCRKTSWSIRYGIAHDLDCNVGAPD